MPFKPQKLWYVNKYLPNAYIQRQFSWTDFDISCIDD